MALRPVEFRLSDGETIAGVEEEDHSGHFTLVFLHETGADLDALLPILGQVGLREARKIALDLPGHGLSSGSFDAAGAGDVLAELRDAMRERGWAPFLFVAAGTLVPHALELADAADTLGLCLVSPRTGSEGICAVPRCPVLAFVSSSDGAAAADWLAVRAALNSWWMSVSIGADHAALVSGDGPAGSQIASHLQGFARDMYVTSPLLAGRSAPGADPHPGG